MHLLVIGASPAAQRRARLLAALGHSADCAELHLRPQSWSRTQWEGFGNVPVKFQWAGAPDHGRYEAALICTPAHTRVQVALECLRVGVGGLFIEAPIANSLDGLDELQYAGRGRTVMIGCPLRFAFDLPPCHWSLLELISSRSRNTQRTGALLAHGRGLSPEVAYPELDLAYAVNGKVYRLDCLSSTSHVRMRIEHENMAHTIIRVDACARRSRRRLAIIGAWDDGNEVHVPDKPRRYKQAPDDRMLLAELRHFLHCVDTGTAPCNTVADAAYLLGLTLQTTAAAAARA